VLVFEAVQEFGLPVPGALVLATGLLQILIGALRWGRRWFRAISVAVVEGMLAGIGLVLIAGRLNSMAGTKAPAEDLAKIAGLPGMLADAVGSPGAQATLGLGAGTIAVLVLVLVLWKKLPKAIQVIPAPWPPSDSPHSPQFCGSSKLSGAPRLAY
jgi:MFS superfamily sulfate permease-like transporter